RSSSGTTTGSWRAVARESRSCSAAPCWPRVEPASLRFRLTRRAALPILHSSLALSSIECQRRPQRTLPQQNTQTPYPYGGSRMKLKPLGDRLIVKPVEEEETTASGIVLPDTAKEKPQKGEVLAAGDGRLDDDGKRIPLDVKKGDEVLYSKYGGTERKLERDDLPVLRESDVLARVES